MQKSSQNYPKNSAHNYPPFLGGSPVGARRALKMGTPSGVLRGPQVSSGALRYPQEPPSALRSPQVSCGAAGLLSCPEGHPGALRRPPAISCKILATTCFMTATCFMTSFMAATYFMTAFWFMIFYISTTEANGISICY